MKSQGARNKRNGSNWERKLAQRFREVGFDRCKTTRQTSRLLDACKVDLDFIPWNIQAKNVNNINYQEVINEVKTALQVDYPERLEYPIVVMHKKKTNKLAVMDIEDFFKLVKRLKECEDASRAKKESI